MYCVFRTLKADGGPQDTLFFINFNLALVQHKGRDQKWGSHKSRIGYLNVMSEFKPEIYVIKHFR